MGVQCYGNLCRGCKIQTGMVSIEEGARMKKYREWVKKLEEEGQFDGENYKKNTAATLALLSLAAEGCDLLEEIRDEIKLRKDDGR